MPHRKYFKTHKIEEKKRPPEPSSGQLEPSEPPELIGAVVVGSDEYGSGAPIPDQIIISPSVSHVQLWFK